MTENSFTKIKSLTLKVKETYETINQKRGLKKWETSDYLTGMIGDCGDLCKLIMVKNNLRNNTFGDLDEKIEHELVDILWSLIIIADGLDIDIENASFIHLKKLQDSLNKINT